MMPAPVTAPVRGRPAGAGRAIPSATAPSGPAVITGVTGSPAYFTDQYGSPRLLLNDTVWNLIPFAGKYTSGNWQGDLDGYCNARGAQGFTSLYTTPMSTTGNGGPFADGRTWDGVYPFTSNGTAGDIGSGTPGLNDPFWQRVDYLAAACARNGIVLWLNMAYGSSGDLATGGSLFNLTGTQYTQVGTALAARYAAVKNIMWAFGGDYFGGTGGATSSADDALASILTGLRNGGDSHAVSIENYAETTSRFDMGTGTAGTEETWGFQHATFSFLYTYIQSYYGIEYAWGEASPLAPAWSDGYYYQNTANAYFGTDDRAMRQQMWWAYSSGARGAGTASEDIWPWSSTSLAQVTNEYYFTHVAGNIRSAIEALPGWHKLQPDVNSTLVTGGRGTHCSETTSGGGGSQYGTATTDSYVTASWVSDGSLALIYLSHATTITIDQSKMRGGYTARWIDPSSGAAYAGTTGSTYNSGAADGSKAVSNSAGDPDWVLALVAS